MAAYDILRGQRRIGATTGLSADLARRLEETGRPIRVGLIGSGEMGTDIVTQCQQMTGITVAAIAEINLDSAKKALRIAGHPAADDAPADHQQVEAFGGEAGEGGGTGGRPGGGGHRGEDWAAARRSPSSARVGKTRCGAGSAAAASAAVASPERTSTPSAPARWAIRTSV